jgi:hypothetical protein
MDGRKRGIGRDYKLDVLADQAAQHRLHAGHDVVEVERLGGQLLSA